MSQYQPLHHPLRDAARPSSPVADTVRVAAVPQTEIQSHGDLNRHRILLRRRSQRGDSQAWT